LQLGRGEHLLGRQAAWHGRKRKSGEAWGRATPSEKPVERRPTKRDSIKREDPSLTTLAGGGQEDVVPDGACLMG